MTTYRGAFAQVSLDLLERILDLPEGMRIREILAPSADEIMQRTRRVMLEGEQLIGVPEGGSVPRIQLVYETDETGKARFKEFVYA
jgi:hypothetical protein